MKPVNTDNYCLGYSTHPDCSNPLPPTHEPVCVGEIKERRSGKDLAYLFYDPYAEVRKTYRMCVTGTNIFFDVGYHALLYSGDPRKVALFEAAVMHELGHIIMQHDLQHLLLGKNDAQLRKERRDNTDHALRAEYEADSFAASVCGVDKVVALLDYLTEYRKNYAFDTNRAAAIKEFALRQRHLLSAKE